MTLTASGTLSLSQINVELGRSADYTVSFHDSWMQALAGLVSASAGTTISLSSFFGKTGIATPFLAGQSTSGFQYTTYTSGNMKFFNGVWRGLTNSFGGTTGIAPYIFATTAQSTGAGLSYLGPVLITNQTSGVSVRFTYLHRIDHGSGEIEDDWQGDTFPANFIYPIGGGATYKIQPTT